MPRYARQNENSTAGIRTEKNEIGLQRVLLSTYVCIIKNKIYVLMMKWKPNFRGLQVSCYVVGLHKKYGNKIGDFEDHPEQHFDFLTSRDQYGNPTSSKLSARTVNFAGRCCKK